MHFFVSKHFLVSLPVPWPVQKQGCFMPENIPGHFGHTGKDSDFGRYMHTGQEPKKGVSFSKL